MKALVKTGPREEDLELKTDWPEAEPDPVQVKLRIAAAGICGTDIHILKGTWRCDYPVAIGHEFCGTVEAVGESVKGFEAGDRVVAANPAKTCGMCRHCLAGNPFMCPERVSAGYMIDGAFAETLCIDAIRCHKLPDNVSFKAAALGEPISVAVHAVIERTQVHAGDLAFVSGPGCVGLLVSQVAMLEGARVVIAGTAKDQKRLECARDLGVERAIDVSKEDPVAVVHEMTGGEGADIVYECAGRAESLAACWKAVKKEGTLVPVGMYPGPIETDMSSISMKELRVIGTYGYVWTSWRRTVKLLAEGKIDAERLVSHVYPLERYAEAFRATQDGTAVKVVLAPGG